MESSRLPLYAWFFTAHLMTSFKQVLSAKEIQHQLEMKEYPPVWLMMMKLRDVMGKRDAMYKLSDQVELDVSYFPTSVLVEDNGEKVLETKKTTVLVIAESNVGCHNEVAPWRHESDQCRIDNDRLGKRHGQDQEDL